MGISLEVVPAMEEFNRYVVDRSLLMLAGGLTPNPCLFCNEMVKFGILSLTLEPGEVLVTGHYARRTNDGEGLLRGMDRGKDQSYFLSIVPGSILRRCRFPLGGMTKDQVRMEAYELGLPCRTDESMDLCFDPARIMPPVDQGRMIGLDGKDFGPHSGLHLYTIGQRARVPSIGERLFVIGKDTVTGSLILGKRKDLLCDECTLEELNWLSGAPPEPGVRLLAQTRYRRAAVPALVETVEGGHLRVMFERPEEAVAPGQACALYLDSDELLGGGLISSVLRREQQ